MRLQTNPCSAATRAGAALAITVGLAVAPAPAGASSGEGGEPLFGWQLLDSGTELDISALDAVSADVAWVGTYDRQILLTVDGGTTFTDVAPPEGEAEALTWHDVEAINAEVALAIALVPDAPPRMYRTADGGASWTETFRAETSASFYNCIAMFDRRHGMVTGDPVDGEFEILVTSNGGRSWDLVSGDRIPDPLENEFGVTLGGDCAATTGQRGFFGTGFAAESRVFRTDDLGQTWQVSSTGTPDLVNALDFRTNRLGLATGVPLLRTTDGGLTWGPVDAIIGFRSDVAWWADLRGDQRPPISDAQKTAFTVGFDGSDVSRDRGKTWQRFDDGAFTTLDCVENTLSCWAGGPGGRIALLTYESVG